MVVDRTMEDNSKQIWDWKQLKELKELLSEST